MIDWNRRDRMHALALQVVEQVIRAQVQFYGTPVNLANPDEILVAAYLLGLTTQNAQDDALYQALGLRPAGDGAKGDSAR